MEILYFFESIRNPVLNAFFSFITNFGNEMLFIIAGLVVFWCIDKYEGYFMLSVGLLATLIGQFLKIFCRIPRPWVADENFTTVGNSIDSAGGYSFPSGHSLASVSLYGGVARWNKQKSVRAVAITLCILVPVSRLYLGVHTPLDVSVGAAIALALVFLIFPLVKSQKRDTYLAAIFLSLSLLSLAFVFYCEFYRFDANVDAENLLEAKKNAYTLLGTSLGLITAFVFDFKKGRFSTEAPLFGQILKCILGAVAVLGIKAGTKPLLILLFGDIGLNHTIRYFLIVIFAGMIWPLTFPYFGKIGKKR